MHEISKSLGVGAGRDARYLASRLDLLGTVAFVGGVVTIVIAVTNPRPADANATRLTLELLSIARERQL